MICKIYTLRLNENEGCIIVENEAEEMIASSGCEEGIPTLCTKFCQAWVNNPLPEVEIWESDVLDISNAYTEEFGYLFTPQIENEEERFHSEGDVFQESYQDYLDNQMPEIPSEIHLETDQPLTSSETEAYLLEVDEFYNEHPTGGNIVMEVWEKKDFQSSQITQDALEKTEHEARKNMKKHILVKRKDLPKRVDWEMLLNSSHLIWNAGHLLGLGQDPNNEVITLGQEAVKNLELFLSLMPNPKFATVSSFQIEKHGKN